ncbi:MAG: BBE domain-containing protein [Actinomycetota bacterium]|nr:BBE domain-containing protein [Actinomycetota bacterium]
MEANFEDASGAEENVAWVREVIADMRPFSDGGVYLNFPGFMEDDEEMRREGYGANYDRLAAIKAKYDPANVFRLNANVEPRAG